LDSIEGIILDETTHFRNYEARQPTVGLILYSSAVFLSAIATSLSFEALKSDGSIKSYQLLKISNF
jgi:hypothetical protein